MTRRDVTEPTRPAVAPRRGIFTTPLMLAGGGAAAGFCAASCCGLPVLFGSLGLGSGWLVAVAWLAAPYRIFLLVAAGILMAGGVGAFLWRRRVACCAVSAAPAGLAAAVLLATVLLIGSALVLLGYLYA